ncbi:MAG TPA: hypothetical protein VIM09_07475, partial [Chthoniobacterales bacterium]
MLRVTRGLVIGIALCLVAFLAGCGGTDRRQPVNRSARTTTAPFIELLADTSAGTIHFPRGLYALDSEDSHGYY